MEFETITGDEVAQLIRGEQISRPTDDDDTRTPSAPAVPTTGVSKPPQRDPDPDTGGMEPQPSS